MHTFLLTFYEAKGVQGVFFSTERDTQKILLKRLACYFGKGLNIGETKVLGSGGLGGFSFYCVLSCEGIGDLRGGFPEKVQTLVCAFCSMEQALHRTESRS